MDKLYTFYEEGWWDSNGCDCCEDVYMEVYNSEEVDTRLGSAHSEEDCYAYAILSEKGIDSLSEEQENEVWDMEFSDLLRVSEQIGLVVKIVKEEV